MRRRIAIATLIAGTLDICWAMILTVIFGRAIPDMLRYVASGPLPGAVDMGAVGALVGLLVHYALMALMAVIFFAILDSRQRLQRQPYLWGLLFGLGTYFAMNWLVVPLRFGTPLPPSPMSVASQLFAHLVLVGLTFGWVADRSRSVKER